MSIFVYGTLAAQTNTTVINFQTWSPSSTTCIFSSPTSVPTTINGTASSISNQANIGQVNYSTANHAVSMSTVTNGVLGTMFSMPFAFTAGKNYSIRIVADALKATPSDSDPRLYIDVHSNGLGTNVLCNGPGAIGPMGSGSYQHSQTIFNTGYTEYNFDLNPPIAVSKNTLSISALPGAAPNSTATIYIRKITITETPGVLQPSFTVSASPTTITCGAATPVTFTVNNVNGTTGVTGYTWSIPNAIGSTDNGWLYAGSPAPTTINTVGNTLTLTQNCIKTQGAVTASATAQGNTYNAGGTNLTLNSATMSIAGNQNLICNAETYSISGIPCGATVAWSISPATGVASLSSSTGSSVTITKTGSGNISLTAAVTSCVGTLQTYNIPSIKVGATTASDITIQTSNGVTSYCYGTSMAFFINNANLGLTNINWTFPSNWNLATSGTTTTYVALTPQSVSGAPPPATITITGTEPCGSIISKSITLNYSSTACAGAVLYTLSPNPASSYIYIQSTNPSTKIFAVQITDMSGNILVNQTYSGIATTQYVTFSTLPIGPKIAKIYNGTTWYNIQFVTQ